MITSELLCDATQIAGGDFRIGSAHTQFSLLANCDSCPHSGYAFQRKKSSEDARFWLIDLAKSSCKTYDLGMPHEHFCTNYNQMLPFFSSLLEGNRFAHLAALSMFAFILTTEIFAPVRRTCFYLVSLLDVHRCVFSSDQTLGM